MVRAQFAAGSIRHSNRHQLIFLWRACHTDFQRRNFGPNITQEPSRSDLAKQPAVQEIVEQLPTATADAMSGKGQKQP